MTRALCLLALAALLAGCCSAGDHRWLSPGHLVYHDACMPPIPDNISQADLDRMREAPPQMSPQAHLLPPGKHCAVIAAAWAAIDLDPTSQPCVRACQEGRVIPPGCWAICEQMAGHPQAPSIEHTDCSPDRSDTLSDGSLR
jgi:hypothetical protein